MTINNLSLIFCPTLRISPVIFYLLVMNSQIIFRRFQSGENDDEGQYDENGQYIGGEDEGQYDENGQYIGGEEGQYDENGQYIGGDEEDQYDENGQYIDGHYDEEGQYIDEEENKSDTANVNEENNQDNFNYENLDQTEDNTKNDTVHDEINNNNNYNNETNSNINHSPEFAEEENFADFENNQELIMANSNEIQKQESNLLFSSQSQSKQLQPLQQQQQNNFDSSLTNNLIDLDAYQPYNITNNNTSTTLQNNNQELDILTQQNGQDLFLSITSNPNPSIISTDGNLLDSETEKTIINTTTTTTTTNTNNTSNHEELIMNTNDNLIDLDSNINEYELKNHSIMKNQNQNELKNENIQSLLDID